jgi:preflagellin peptidase FlaK
VQVLLDLARSVIASVFLIYSSYSDYKTREVSNVVWMLFAPPAFALTFIELLFFESSELILYGICFGLTAGFAIILFYSGGFGGADAKALMCLALALPFYPVKLFMPILGEISPISQTFFPITIFSNSVLFAASTAVALLLYNVSWRATRDRRLFEGGQKDESLGKKFLVLVTGYKVPIDKLKKQWHVYPLEDIEKDDNDKMRRKLVVLPNDEHRSRIVERLDRAILSGEIQDKIWATPGLPMLIFITAGLVAALLLGDIVWAFVRFVLR